MGQTHRPGLNGKQESAPDSAGIALNPLATRQPRHAPCTAGINHGIADSRISEGKPGAATTRKNRSSRPGKAAINCNPGLRNRPKRAATRQRGNCPAHSNCPEAIRETAPRTANPPRNQPLKPRPAHGRNPQRWPAVNRRTQGKSRPKAAVRPPNKGINPSPLTRQPTLPPPTRPGISRLTDTSRPQAELTLMQTPPPPPRGSAYGGLPMEEAKTPPLRVSALAVVAYAMTR